jgi:MFS family permease
LRIRNYRLFATGQILKLLGVWMMFTAQDWLVLELTDNSASALGAVVALQFTPILLFTLYGGKLADRYDKRRMLLVVNVVSGVLALAMAVLVFTGQASLAWVLVFALLLGTANAIETPVRQVFVAEMVERELIPNAMALSAAGFNVGRMLGPALAGLVIAVADVGPVFTIATVAYLAPVVALAMIRSAELRPTERTAESGGVRDGLRYARSRADIVLPLTLLFFVALFGFNFPLTLAVLSKGLYGKGAAQFGLLTSALSIGSMAGAFAGSGRRARPSIYVILFAAIGFGVLEIAVGFAPSYLLTAVLLVPLGFFTIYMAQATNQNLQLGVDPAYRGRVVSMFVLVFLGTNPIGSLMMGWLVERYGARFGLWFGGLVSLLAAALALTWQLRRSGARIRLQVRPLPKLYVSAPSEALALAGRAETTVA